MPAASLSTFFYIVAEAVLSQTLEKLELTDHAREWLRRDPARVAYQKALARAYTAFSRQYPDLSASLFDEFFLKNKAASELAKQLTRHQKADPANLAELWAESVGSSTVGHGLAPVNRAASNFLLWLESELKMESVFRPITDSRALESLPLLEAKLDILTSELNRAYETVLKQASKYQEMILAEAGRASRAVRNDINLESRKVSDLKINF